MSCTLLRGFVAVALGAVAAPVSLAEASSTSSLAPGDILFTEFFDGWHKLDPATGHVTPLPWDSSIFTDDVAFDVDGAILFDDVGGVIKRLNPTTGRITSLGVPGIPFIEGFVVEPNGDLLIGAQGELSRYSRSMRTTTTVTAGEFFSPSGVARTDDGRVFVTEFFEGLWEVDVESGGRELVTTFDLSIPDRIVAQSSGSLIVENFSPGVLYSIDPDTGAVSLFTDDLPTFVEGFALDAQDNLWLSATDGIYRYDSSGGAKTLIAEQVFFSPKAIAVVPLDWTAPPIPEPASGGLAACLAMAAGARPLRSRRARPTGA